jgi:hypothetical protein
MICPLWLKSAILRLVAEHVAGHVVAAKAKEAKAVVAKAEEAKAEHDVALGEGVCACDEFQITFDICHWELNIRNDTLCNDMLLGRCHWPDLFSHLQNLLMRCP